MAMDVLVLVLLVVALHVLQEVFQVYLGVDFVQKALQQWQIHLRVLVEFLILVQVCDTGPHNSLE